MADCNFETNNCNVLCKKYSMCSYLSIQKQITELQQQINFIFTTINNIIERESSTNKNVEELNEKLLTYSGDMLDLINNTLRKQPES